MDKGRMKSGLAGIRSYYRVPAFRGGSVLFYGERYEITSARSGRIRVRHSLNGLRLTLHPTWRVEYIGESEEAWPGMNRCFEEGEK